MFFVAILFVVMFFVFFVFLLIVFYRSDFVESVSPFFRDNTTYLLVSKKFNFFKCRKNWGKQKAGKLKYRPKSIVGARHFLRRNRPKLGEAQKKL